jgi:predicted acyltransferase
MIINSVRTRKTIKMENRQSGPVTGRLLSLDFFRGFTIAAMILVNNMGDHHYAYKQLGHSEWHGCTFTDLVFPFFLYIVGVSIVFALAGKKQEVTHSRIILAALRRSLVMVSLSFILFLIPKVLTNPIEAIQTLRIQGVLFRIAVVYFISVIIFLKFNIRGQVILGIVCLILYWWMLNFIPVPGIGAPNLNAGTDITSWLDRVVFTTSHLLNKTWDPQALLGTITACATAIFGMVAGWLLKNNTLTGNTRVAWLSILGIITVLAALLWNYSFPINKSLWTSSYVLYTGGLASICLAISYWIIDVQGYKWGVAPFVAFGRNAITVYFLSELLPRIMNLITFQTSGGGGATLRGWIYKTLFVSTFSSPYHASLASGIFYVLVFLGLAWWMYGKNIIVKI